MANRRDWFVDYINDDATSSTISEYEVTASPNDFNITTIFSFINAGSLKIPAFQRHYVWDIKRASKLIESIIIGLPIPQVFLYEKSRNEFHVIDGQQRLMTIYYFMKGRFPRREKRGALRQIFDRAGSIPESTLADDEFFQPFSLQLPNAPTRPRNKFNLAKYLTLGEYQQTFDLRTIRNVIVKQNSPPDDNSAIYEIFHRLNTGGTNLKPQEIRMSLFHSEFYNMLFRVNTLSRWREMLNIQDPDPHMKDIEILLRGFAMLMHGDEYASPMTTFLNAFSGRCRSLSATEVNALAALFESFLKACEKLPERPFLAGKGQFNISLYEAVFAAVAGKAFRAGTLVSTPIEADQLKTLQSDSRFVSATQFAGTAHKRNVDLRLATAAEILGG